MNALRPARRPRRASTSTLLVLLVAAALPGMAAGQGPVPAPSPSPSPVPEASDGLEGLDASALALYEDMPEQLGGFEPVIEVTRGEEHFTNLDLDDPIGRETAAELEGLLAATGASVEDMSSAFALASVEDFFAFVVAIRIDGADEEALLRAYLPILLGDLDESTVSEERIEGRSVVAITTTGDDGEPAVLHVHVSGDTVWVIQAPRDVVAATLAGVP